MDAADHMITVEDLRGYLSPWKESLKDPSSAQRGVLDFLLGIYRETDYGQMHHAGRITNLQEYRNAFPICTHEDYKPIIDQVMAGHHQVLLNEEPVGWAITRGTTKGETKFIPMTQTDLGLRVSAGRAMLNYVVENNRPDLFDGVNLNLNFPSEVGSIQVGSRRIAYGYSSGIYTRYVSAFTPIRSVPSQQDIDALGGGKTIRDWENRFELAYEKCKMLNVTLVGGVAPTALDFARFLKKKHNHYPKDIWKIQIMTLGSVPGINTRLEPALKAMYGQPRVREIYGATEGMFGQQMDQNRAWVPNYDIFLFEVSTHSGIKMLYEMKPGEMGSLVVSTPVLPRYRIGDIIVSVKQPYFRCIGREKWWTPLRYVWDEFSSFNLGRL